MSNIVFSIYNGLAKEGGVYDILASFCRGLLKGFQDAGLEAYAFEECVEKNIDFDVAIGFNCAGISEWGKVLHSGKISVFYSVDSIFAQNAQIPVYFKKYDNFITFCVAPSDYAAAQHYMPELKFIYMPHAVDDELWVKKNVEKENDIVFFASVLNYETKLEELKNQQNKTIYSLVMEISDICAKRPNLTFWEIYNLIKSSCDFELDQSNYTQLYNYVTFIAEQKQKIKMIQSLSNLNVKVFGNELWKKYIKGKVEYKGKANVLETVDIVNKSKICLHCHPIQLNQGLHERFLNAACAGSFCLVSKTPSIEKEFKDTFGYFDHSEFNDIEQKARYYLNNDKIREQMAQNSREIVLNNHLWKHRAIQIEKLFSKT